jgi:lipoprotein-anchoring transpeptidase ErfK/SrfK
MDWTEGCIALTDEEMDLIYSKINIGTPVIIVGSTVGIEHALTK